MTTSQTSLSLNPSTSALIMVDMQNDFAHPDGFYGRYELPIPGFDCGPVRDAIPAMQKLLHAARETGMFVVHTQIGHESFLNRTSRPRKVVAKSFAVEPGRPPHLVPGTWGAETLQDLGPVEGEYILRKYNYSAFYGTSLEQVLRRQGVDTVVIGGTVTYACVMHTAFDAQVRDFDVVVPSDGVGSWVPDLQEPALRIMELLLGAVLPVDEIVASLTGEKSQIVAT